MPAVHLVVVNIAICSLSFIYSVSVMVIVFIGSIKLAIPFSCMTVDF